MHTAVAELLNNLICKPTTAPQDNIVIVTRSEWLFWLSGLAIKRHTPLHAISMKKSWHFILLVKYSHPGSHRAPSTGALRYPSADDCRQITVKKNQVINKGSFMNKYGIGETGTIIKLTATGSHWLSMRKQILLCRSHWRIKDEWMRRQRNAVG